MAPPYHNPPPSSFHELNEDDHHHHDLFNRTPQTCSSLSLSSPMFINPAHDHQEESYNNSEAQKFQVLQVEANKKISCDGSCDQHPTEPENIGSHHHDNIDGGLKLSTWNNIDDQTNENQSVDLNNINSVKWMSSKMRMMRKMMNSPDHQTILSTDPPVPLQHLTQKLDDNKKKHPAILSPLGATDSSSSNNNSSNSSNIDNSSNTIRVCADCNTTKTPLWRSGPRGPKSLCNACGIRQRKARRAMAAAAAANGTINNVTLKGRDGAAQVQQKDKKSRKIGCDAVQFKKRTTKLSSPNKRRINNEKLCFEELTIKYMMSKNSAFQRSVFPQDEKEAAILLMALSYGLVHG